ncbi:MAG TPA: glycosyltransferase [Labilithrix sp.]|nr:glycosyltransferase [Labilithrix sp.]
MSLRFVFFGLSITSSWGNGHATTYRGLVKSLVACGHEVTFLERDLPFYADNRDLPSPPYGRTYLYSSLDELYDRFAETVRQADIAIVGSYVPDGIAVGTWVQCLAPGRAAFYDIDTPVTLANLANGTCSYIAREQVERYALYLSFTGGPTLERLEKEFGSPCARALYCSVDAELHSPSPCVPSWDLGYLGTYSEDRQPMLEGLLLEPARSWPTGRFVVAGPQYPDSIAWPRNVARLTHLAPDGHRNFYNAQRFTLNVTRRAMVAAGWSPSVRLFEAAACATPIITDRWPGIEEVLTPGREILIAERSEDALRFLEKLPEDSRIAIGAAARNRILAEHTSMHRAEKLERLAREMLERNSRRSRGATTPSGIRTSTM